MKCPNCNHDLPKQGLIPSDKRYQVLIALIIGLSLVVYGLCNRWYFINPTTKGDKLTGITYHLYSDSLHNGWINIDKVMNGE